MTVVPRPIFLKFTWQLTLITAAFLSSFSSLSHAQTSINFTADQALAGKNIYRETCQICHGSSLSNGQFGTPLKGGFFRRNWAGKSVGELLQFTFEKMPPDSPMQFSREQYAEVVAYIFERNSLEPGEHALNSDHETMYETPLPWD